MPPASGLITGERLGPRVLLLSLNYAPEPTGFAPHVTALCEHLVRKGYRVTVLTGFPFAPRWKRWPEYTGAFIRRENHNGVCVLRLTHWIPRTPGRLVERVLMEGSFCLTSFLALFWYQVDFDGVIYIGAQPSIAMLSRWASWLRGAFYGVFINDLAAGAAMDVGIVKSRRLQSVLRAFEFAAYRRARHAVVLCRAFEDALRVDGYPAQRISLVRSPVNLEQVRPMPVDDEFRQNLGLESADFVVMFAGSMGLKQGLENVVAAAVLLRRTAPTVKWVLVGEGETKPQIELLVAQSGVQDVVRFLPFQPVELMSPMFSCADVLLLNQLSAVKDTVIPSKLLTYMAAGRPVLAAVNEQSQGAEILRESGGGIIARPEDPEDLAMGVKRLMECGPIERATMASANRTFALQHFDEGLILSQLEKFVASVVSKGDSSGSPV